MPHKLQNITVLIPLFNEENLLDELFGRLLRLPSEALPKLHFLLVDDGSTDRTPMLISRFVEGREDFSAVFLSRNFGHSRAITAGLMHVGDEADAVFLLDGDLQDPPELLSGFVEKMDEGYDVVYGIRNKRKEGPVKRFCYHAYYRLLRRSANISMPLDAGDFSLISRKVVRQLQSMPEESRYIRGMRSWVGFPQTGIPYERASRHSGDSKYSLSGLLKLAGNGLFNFSELPVRFIGIMGMLAVFPSLIYLLVTLAKKLLYGSVPEGFTALIFAIVLFSGVQLLSLAIIGEYVLRIFFQVKQRPLFLVKSKIIKGKVVHE
jgi:dolichol-phosphate mannosyltransferase